MKHFLSISLVLLFLLLACKKEPFEELTQEPNTPLFSVDYVWQGRDYRQEAGINDYYMYSSFNRPGNLLNFNSHLKENNACQTCPNSIEIILADYDTLIDWSQTFGPGSRLPKVDSFPTSQLPLFSDANKFILILTDSSGTKWHSTYSNSWNFEIQNSQLYQTNENGNKTVEVQVAFNGLVGRFDTIAGTFIDSLSGNGTFSFAFP